MSEEKKKLMQRAGISEPSDLLLCGATELDALRDALKPIPRRMFEDYRRKYLMPDGPNGRFGIVDDLATSTIDLFETFPLTEITTPRQHQDVGAK